MDIGDDYARGDVTGICLVSKVFLPQVTNWHQLWGGCLSNVPISVYHCSPCCDIHQCNLTSLVSLVGQEVFTAAVMEALAALVVASVALWVCHSSTDSIFLASSLVKLTAMLYSSPQQC